MPPTPFTSCIPLQPMGKYALKPLARLMDI